MSVKSGEGKHVLACLLACCAGCACLLAVLGVALLVRWLAGLLAFCDLCASVKHTYASASGIHMHRHASSCLRSTSIWQLSTHVLQKDCPQMSNMKNPPSGCNYLISLDGDANWIVDYIAGSNETKSWLKHSLSWLPNSILVNYGLD